MSVRTARLTPVLAFAGMLLSGAPVFGQATPAATTTMDPAKVALIRELITVTNIANVMVTQMEATIPAQREAMPQLPKEFWDEFMARARKDLPKFVELLIPIWDKQYSKAQLEELVKFYKSPLGRHVASVQPAISQQVAQAGQRWGQQLGIQVADTLRKRGVQMPE